MAQKNRAYFAPLVTKPVIITGPGQYKTRNGDIVTIHKVSRAHDFGCGGHYSDDTYDSWHKSGRIFATSESQNDIVSRA